MTIKVLGSGCPNCQRLEANVRLVLDRTGIQATVEKVTDYDAILAYGVGSTPALVVDEQVVLAGHVPGPRQLERILTRP